jgi:hypothetical protein
MRMLDKILASTLLATTLTCASFSALAAPQRVVDPPAETLVISGADADLRQVLGGTYPAFARNFAVTAHPVALKDGGLFVDGWRTGAPLTHAAAFVHYADGRTFAAYFDEDRGEIIYVGDGPVHPALQIWARRFGPALHVTPPASSSTSVPRAASNSASRTAAPTPEDQVELRKVAASVWGTGLASGWDMNAAVGDILGTVTNEIMECSAAFSLVPKPVGWVPGWSYVAKSALSIVAYVTGVSKDRRYQTCVNGAAANWRSAIEIASAGL